MYYYLSPSCILDKDVDMVKEIGCNNAIMITMCTGLYIFVIVTVVVIVAVAVVAEVVVILDVVMVVVVVID